MKEKETKKTTVGKEKSAAGFIPAIGEDEVRAAEKLLSDYKAAKASLDRRITDNEEWFRLRHWENLRKRDSPRLRSSAWLFNSIVNKHADFMDAIPGCTVLPRENSDTAAANGLTDIIPVILDANNWESVYSDAAFYKLKTGTAVYSVLWNPLADNGLGDIDIKQADILNLFWEPGVKDIQNSRNIFYLQPEDNDILLEKYPFLEGKLGSSLPETVKYTYDYSVDTSNKSTVVDWYYKKTVNSVTVLHYVKFVNSCVLYASENDSRYKDTGWYDHGRYPFIFDPLYKEEGTPVGFGYIDVMKDAQEEIDILGNEILRNAKMAARKRYFSRVSGSVNEEEFADFDKDFVHVSGSSLGEESLREIAVNPLPSIYVTVLNNKINELKETSGNRDFTQGGTAGGVTSGTAITALQEAGNKLSRDMIASTYRAFTQMINIVIELIRQFYSVPRSMRILGESGEWGFRAYDNTALLPASQGEEYGVRFGDRVPVFDVCVKAHKQNTFSRAAQNQDALNFFKLGFFDPAKSTEALACLQLIDIENKEKLTHIIEENGADYRGNFNGGYNAVPGSGEVRGDRY